jgi:glycosyltransferase involved in cell wall biosynthesis
VPVHNGEAHLAQAIDSILAQTHRPIEVVVVDNASTDRSRDIAREYGPPVLWAPSKLEHQLVHLEGPPRIEVSFCGIENFWDDGLEHEQEQWAAAGRLRGTYLLQTALARRSVFTRVPLQEDRPHTQHLAWLLGLRSADVTTAELPTVLVHRRRHETNITRVQIEEHFDELFAMLNERVSSSRNG